MLGVRRAVGALTVTTLAMMGCGVATSSAAEARPTHAPCGILSSLAATKPPIVSGPGVAGGVDAVGDALSITTSPTWSCEPSSTTIQWFRGIEPIEGETGSTYVPKAEDVGKVVTAVVSAYVASLLPVPVTSNPIVITAADEGATGSDTSTVLDLLQPLTVTGTPAVGQALTVATPAWSLPGVTTSYQWLRNGVPLPDATTSTYTPVATDTGASLQARVTGSLAGLVDVVRTTALVQVPAAPGGGTDGGTNAVLDLLAPLTVVGTPAVGQVLSVMTPTWSLPDVTTTYQWLRNGVPIPDATTQAYTAAISDAGTDLQARITGSLTGMTDVVRATSLVPIPASPGGGTGPATGAALDLLAPLTMIGTPAVGQLLSVATPAWSLPGVTTSYQWLRNDVPIPGATHQVYVPVSDDAGTDLQAQVTGALAGLSDVVRTTSPVRIPAVDQVPLGLSDAMSVTGDRRIGTILQASGPAWSPAAATTTYQWLRDGGPIAGATHSSYLLQTADFGHLISVAATGELAGWLARTVSSDPFNPGVGGALATSRAPRITGGPRVGALLTADPGDWTGGDLAMGTTPTFSYQWMRDEHPIDGAVAQTYQATVADIGSALTVTVTAVRPGFAPGEARTSSVRVAKLRSVLRVRMVTKVVRATRHGIVRIGLHAPGVRRPTGVVKVIEGRRVVARSAFKRSSFGSVSLRLHRLKAGRHRLKVVYLGTPTIAPSTSRVVRLTVRK